MTDVANERIITAIDVGTNSIHMVVVRIETTLPSFNVIATEKATVRLGERCAKTGMLTKEAMERSLLALARCLEISRSFNAEAIISVATSAVREAPNGQEFIDTIEEKLGLTVDLISGQEEARRIYLGVLSALELNNQPHVIIDIGGGSTELILGNGHDPDYLSSTKVGAVRLSDLYITTDPISDREFEKLQIYIRGMLERPTDELKLNLGNEPVRLIGTSGSIEAVAMIHAKQTLGTIPEPLQGYEISIADVENVVLQLRQMTLAQRTALAKEKRGEIILAGAMILWEAMRLLNAGKLTICQRSLREGLIVNWMIEHGLIADRLQYQGSIRDRSVIKLAQKYNVDLDYGKQVARLALSLFDQTQGILHKWGEQERDLLKTAAILHNSGCYISHSSHHKHSYYLIRNGELLGYTEAQIEAIANLARYHRRSEPKKKHETYRKLTNKRYRQFVDEINPLLRLAVALDRRQIGAVKGVKVKIDSKAKQFHLGIIPVEPNDPCTLELWSLDFKKEALEAKYQLTLVSHLLS
ncbi:exopolyphosphatase [Synechococcus sp. PCC 7502]|uniref:Ppx/GppA phosphatase family protein n=1 Tax=Synechococcus sp. PCC 7502 TaxID=1173263 RepID=UPI00029FC1C7|nr:Ppx/GppA phosphatase family protein [Synechococcus sp. PCC 7502]AFY73893.1 exopolyphosphatase [Synechococcus sp. PCC 7502]